MVIEVGYWNLRGLVGFIRLLDVHTDEGIQWRTYETSKSAEWFDEKAKLIETGEIGNVKLHKFTCLRKVAAGEVTLLKKLSSKVQGKIFLFLYLTIRNFGIMSVG